MTGLRATGPASIGALCDLLVFVGSRNMPFPPDSNCMKQRKTRLRGFLVKEHDKVISAFGNAIADLGQGVRMHPVWTALAREDIGDQHRRTALGPLWLLVNYLLFAGTFILIVHRGQDEGYVIYVAVGLLVWFYIMETINFAVSLFVREESFIKGTRLPLSVYVMRMAMQGVIRSSYSLVGCAVILLATGAAPTPAWLWSGVAILLILATTPAAIMLFAMFGAFFPDGQFLVSNLMRIAMFMSPVFWTYRPGDSGIRAVFFHWNPFTYFLEIARAPVLDGTFPTHAFTICLSISVGLWVVSLFVFGKYLREVVFVL